MHNISPVTLDFPESNTRFVNIIEQAPVAMALTAGQDFVFESINDPMLRVIHRRSKTDVLGKKLIEVLPELQNQSVYEILLQVLNSGETFTGVEVPADLTVEGVLHTRYFNITYSRIVEPGETHRILHMSVDVTDQVLARKRVEEDEERFRLMADASPNLIWLLNGDGTYKYVNKKTLDFLGITQEQIAVSGWIPYLHPDEQQTISSAVSVAVKNRHRYREEHRLRDKDGNYRWVLSEAIPAYDAQGELFAYVGSGIDIDDRKRADASLKISEAKYRTLFESMDQGFCILEMIFDNDNEPVDYRFVEVNSVFENQTGLKNAKGNSARALIPNLETHWVKVYGNVALTGEAIRFTEGSAAMGRVFDVYAFRAGDENSRQVALLFTDITQRKKAEQALTQSESNLRNMILQSPVAMAVLRGPSFVVEIANERMYELWGRSKEQVCSRSIFEALPEVKDQGYEELLTGVFTTGKTFTASGVPVTLPRDGKVETVYINLTYEAFRETDGTISGVMAVATDVTEQVVSRMQVEKSHEELQFVMDVMPQLVWHTLPDGSADYFNKVFVNYAGLPVDQLKGLQWTTLVHPEDVDRTIALWQEAVAGKKPYVLEHRLKGADNIYRWFLTRGVPLKDERGNILKWYGTTTDINMQKSHAEILEQKVKERTIELERRNKEMEQFTYAASHDMQEPLRKVATFSNILLDEYAGQLNAEVRRYLSKIDTSVKRMKSIIDDLLHYSHHARADQGFVPTDLNLLLTEIQADLENVIEKKGAEIVSVKLPTVIGVPNQLHQLFYNLLANALKFSKHDISPRVSIDAFLLKDKTRLESLGLAANRTYVQIEITDNGIGFDQHHAQQIFTLFQRLHLKTEYDGTGIGLALCKKIADNHKGHIWAESSVGNGSTFKVCLPIEP